jgi:signal peptidase II
VKGAKPVVGLAFAALAFVADQAVKWAVQGPLGLVYEGDARDVVPVFTVRLVYNRGVSLGLLHADTDVMRWALVVLTAAIAVGVSVWMWREKSRADQIALGAVLGGAIGNILDRARLGYVIDYADLHFGDWRPFLVFNLADAAITLGVLVLLVRALLTRESHAEKVNA